MNVKWADYAITAVRYDGEHNRIEKLEVREDLGTSLSSAFVETRQNVVNSIKNGYTYVTVYKGSNGNWNKGARVEIVSVNNRDYLRTDGNSREADNLGNLPEF